MQETQIRPLCQEKPLETKWQPSLVFLAGESHGQRSLVGYSPWGLKESDTTKRLTHIGYEKLFIQSSDSSTCHFKKSKHKNLKLKLEEWKVDTKSSIICQRKQLPVKSKEIKSTKYHSTWFHLVNSINCD